MHFRAGFCEAASLGCKIGGPVLANEQGSSELNQLGCWLLLVDSEEWIAAARIGWFPEIDELYTQRWNIIITQGIDWITCILSW